MDTIWQRNPTTKQLRDFGWMVGSVLIVLGLTLFWRHPERAAHGYLWFVGAILVVAGLTTPRVLTLPFQLWMAFAFVLGIVMTNLILTITFFVAFALVGLLMRVTGRDPLGLRWASGSQASYWKDRESLAVENRHLRPY